MSTKPTKKPGRRFPRPLSQTAAAEAARRQSDPNVVCVGFGLKFVKGRPTPQAVLQYHVRQKLASEKDIRAIGSEPVPREVDGYATDVLPWVPDRALACPGSKSPTGERGGRKEDPLVGGTSTTVLSGFYSFPTGYGTLGGLCFDASSGDAMALSNAHVYGEETGNEAIQPWLPGTEYLEATLKYLTCGGPAAHLFFWTAPSPLTAILTTAAAAAWAAAIASDAEDPSRWGQRTGPVPAAGLRTERERVTLNADVPRLPFPGRVWKAKTGWDYTRVTSGGPLTAATVDDRANEHVLVGKRVYTDRTLYRGGERVQICAELFTPAGSAPVERFVVAHCFPLADPERITRRVLVPDPGRCGKMERPVEPVCVHGFAEQTPGVSRMTFRIQAPPFILFSDAPTTDLLRGSASGNPSGLNALRVPKTAALRIACPPSTHAELAVFQGKEPVDVVAISANGSEAARTRTSAGPGTVETLVLSGVEIVRIEVSGGGGEGFLAGLCVDKRPIALPDRKVQSRYYTGSFPIRRLEQAGRWGVTVVSQSLDDTPADGDAVTAAGKLGGIVDSANVVEVGQCTCTVLFDATFDVG